MSSRFPFPLVAAALAIAWAPHSLAAEDLPAAPAAKQWELAAQGVYATPPIRGGITPFGAGFGARVGHGTTGVYVGVRGAYFLGGSEIDVADNAILGGAELGYGFRVGRLVVRPLVGLGGLRITHVDPTQGGTVAGSARVRHGGGVQPDVVSGASGASGASVYTFWIGPALTALVAWDGAFVGVDTSMLVLPSVAYAGGAPQTMLTYTLGAQAGLRF